jgi:hypothetical protein
VLRRLFPIYDVCRQLQQPPTLWDLRSPIDASIWYEASNIWMDFHQVSQHEEISKLSLPAQTFKECQKRYIFILQALTAIHTCMRLCTSAIWSLFVFVRLGLITIRILFWLHIKVRVPVFVASIFRYNRVTIPLLIFVEFSLKFAPIPKLSSPGLKQNNNSNEGSITTSGIVSALRTRNCGDPRDKSYSLHGILTNLGVDVSQVDYNKSVSQIYRELLVDLVAWKPQLIFLISYAGLTSSIHPIGPSWVPDWTKLGLLSRLAPVKPEESSQEGPNSYLEPSFEIQGDELTLQVIWDAKVMYCGQDIGLPPTRGHYSSRELQEWSLQYMLEFIIWFQDKIIATLDTSDDGPTFQISTRDGVRMNRSKAYDFIGKAVRKAFTPFGHNPTIDCSYDAYRALFNRWWRFVFDGVDSVRQQRNASSYLLEAVLQDEQTRICQDICSLALQHINLFITTDGDIGSGPLLMMPGDKVAHLPGVATALIFREISLTVHSTFMPWREDSHRMKENSRGYYVLVGRGSIHRESEETHQLRVGCNTETIVVR